MKCQSSGAVVVVVVVDEKKTLNGPSPMKFERLPVGWAFWWGSFRSSA